MAVKNSIRANGRKRVQLQFSQDEEKSVSVTQQHMRDEVEINNVIARYVKTGLVPQRTQKPMYGDFSELPDIYQMKQQSDLLSTLVEDFMNLPSSVRKKFENSPEKMLDFISNPANLEESVKMGLLPKQLLPSPTPKETPAEKQPESLPEA